jgi:hypothetical protein
MQQTNKFNKDYVSLVDDYGRVVAFQCIFFASSGHGKGMAEEGLVEEWKRTTGGIVIILADPKDEAEFSFVNFEPIEKYHRNRIKSDGMTPQSYPVKLYHPFSFNIPKSYLPLINFYSFSLKSLDREDWAILSESKQDSATIRLLTRGCSELKKDEGLFNFLHNIEQMSEGKKKGKKLIEDPKNFYLKKPSGNAKSVVEISSLLSSFRQNYFLRKDSCNHKLNWEQILLDSESYHVFLSMWVGDLKIKEFCVLHLLSSAIKEIQRLSNKGLLKKPVLFVIPEIRRLCPARPEGYKEFLSEAIGDALNTIRSMGRGISFVGDSQDWSQTDERVRNSGESFFGKVGTKDKELICKALSYNKQKKEMLTDLSSPDKKCCFIRFEHEEDGIYRFFLPRHMHKEEKYNWIEMFQKNGAEMKIYDDLKKEMSEEYKFEENEIKEMVKKRIKQEDDEELSKLKKKEQDKPRPIPKKEFNEITPDMDRTFFKMWKIDKISLRDIENKLKSDPLVKIKPSIGTIRTHANDFKKKLEASGQNFGEFDYGKPIISNMIGEGIMPEEIEA